MKKIGLLSFLIICLLVLNGCNSIKSIDVEEYQQYLENKYGKDKDFRMIGEGSGDWFETGYKEYMFISNDSKEFSVTGKFLNGEKNFKDNYIEKKYKDRLESYYKDLLADVLKFDYNIDSVSYYDNNNNVDISFEEYLKYEALKIHLYLETTNTNINFELLQSDINNMITSNKINNIEVISLNVIDCSENPRCQVINNYKLYENKNE